ncbi:MAG: hypothetical protein HY093_00890 [Candidatus Liptonbacteria bacterium]|nr:hypothetical protein [Candidatus Liptonbacteria bacterium]
MVTAIKTKRNGGSKLGVNEVRKLFLVSSNLTDLLEDILESKGEYSTEFLSGLKKSLNEFKSGKVFRINSLSNLR